MAGQSGGIRVGRGDHVGRDARRFDLPHAVRKALAWRVERPWRCLVCANVTAMAVGVLLGSLL